MDQPRYDILGIGNAIVDVVAPVGDDLLARHAMQKGAMALITADEAEALYAAMPPGRLERLESLEQLRALEAGVRIRVELTPEDFPPGVDTDEDLVRAERHLRATAG